jgi:hypothetical protein
MDTRRIGTGVLTFVHRDPIGYWNKAFGFTEPVTDERLAEVDRAADLPRAHARDPAEPRDVANDGLRIERIGADHARAFSRIMHTGFQVDRSEASERWSSDPGFFDDDWATYAAFDGDEHPNPSQHNMRAAGLTEVHVRPNWVYRRQAG